ncbi:MAG: malto-oligosyltrehalose trehalohydrolase [Geobacteraceae bacterium GWC2_58_44]|nr:MAG: malto-oligosyltrehalose trehalohydrolase [Geobacteraceae bacterium GWC2_58_44]HBG07766.1 malto-oligosyltrehalose trehalohydrolase [Geobacter sp.]
MTDRQRRYPVGAELLQEGVHFRIWAPDKKVELVFHGEGAGDPIEMTAEEQGYFSAHCREAAAGTLYRYRLDGGESYPDPASRYQPEGPHGPSCVVDPSFDWSDRQWRGIGREGQVIYEMHIGTYTKEGSWAAAAEQLPSLAELGITVVEVMPVADFPGRFGWGYDGVNHFAPTRLYGEPADMRRFVDRAHSLGLGVLLDVVYNHFGPEGNYLERFSLDYYSPEQMNVWGKEINFDGKNCGPVRDFFIANGAYWIEEYHLDGLRFDATHAMFDKSPEHILGCITERARQAGGGRSVLMVAENESQEVRCLHPKEQGGFGMDAVWNDDFHHSVHVALTGYHDAYYSEYYGSPQELVSGAKWGYLYQGQRYFWHGKRRGTPTIGISPSCFINYTQNHDQVGNSAWGIRLHQLTNPASLRAMTALLLLSPQTPMIFQGQEFSASTPFLFFSDLSPEISRQVHAGRIEFLKQFTNIDSPEVIVTIDKPYNLDTYIRSRLDPGERERNGKCYALYRDLIKLRREDPVFSAAFSCHIEGAVLGGAGLLLRYFLGDQQRLLLFNLGREMHLAPAPEPMLAPPEGERWEVLWTSERIEYGGSGTPKLETDKFWRLQGHAAVALIPVPNGDKDDDGNARHPVKF